ncbi:MAG: LysM peptidoglycan-binding domain-containing protein [Candidatus Limnocylindrales bacterium]
MTLADRPGSDAEAIGASDAPAIVGAICPFLIADDGAWRAARPMREHRCGALQPPGPLTLEKQRRLCLISDHVRCPTYLDAVEARAEARAETLPALQSFAARVDRRVPRAAAVALDRPTVSSGDRSVLGRARGVSRAGLAGLMVAAIVLLVAARFLSAGSLGPATSPSPSSSGLVADASPTASPLATEAATPVPTASPAPPTASPAPSPTPAFSQKYTVQQGDTLSGIATKFGTTVAKLKALNNISDANSIQIGQILKIP